MNSIKIPGIAILAASALLSMTASAQALEPELLYGFQLAPQHPYASLVQGSDGGFYGTTRNGGSAGSGTVFKVTTNGVLTALVSFNYYANGGYPLAGLLLGSDGNFYGTTFAGGSANSGTVFQVTTNAVLTTLVSFNMTNGLYPYAGLVLGDDGNFYGTTLYGGRHCRGTVFQVTTNGVLTTLVSFNYGNGSYPQPTLLLGRDGSFYGTTYGIYGGSDNLGTVFQVTTNGVLTTLVSFKVVSLTNGANPWGGLVMGRDGNFYGTTSELGSGGYGTVFKVATNGEFDSLISFNGPNGANPRADLVLGNDGNFYGTTSSGGPGGGGTIFRLVMPKFTSVARLPGGSVLLTGAGPANEGYRLWASPNVSLPFASWTLMTSNAFGSDHSFSYTDAAAAINASRFYQLTVP